VPADKCPSLPLSYSAPAVPQGSSESSELRKPQNTAIHKAKLSNNDFVLDVPLLPLTAPQEQDGLSPQHQDKGMAPTGLQERSCSALWCVPRSSPPNTQVGSRGCLKIHNQREKALITGLASGLSPTIIAHSPTEHCKSSLERKPIHIEMAHIYLSQYIYMPFGLRKGKCNPYFAKGNPHTETWASGVINTKPCKFFSLSG